MRRYARATLSALLALVLTAPIAGCGAARSYSESREVLGTAVSITVYPEGVAGKAAVGSAFDRMAAVEKTLSPYDESSPVAAVNRDPYVAHRLPLEAVMVFTVMDAWGVGPTTAGSPPHGAVSGPAAHTPGAFSPTLWGVTSLYSFGTSGTVPATARLGDAVSSSTRWVRTGELFRFDRTPWKRPERGEPLVPAEPWAGVIGVRSKASTPGLDFGGAAKGLALDFALQQLGGLDGGLITAGSSTLAFGAKPDGEPWRVGIEDPRATGRVVAVVSATPRPGATGTLPPVPALSVSTSGDYQLFFERGGVRYHHILDPATGKPAGGLRSLTVFGRMNGLDADILSTALFVMGRDRALAFARQRAIGVYLVDAGGRAASYVPPGLKGVALETKAEPRP